MPGSQVTHLPLIATASRWPMGAHVSTEVCTHVCARVRACGQTRKLFHTVRREEPALSAQQTASITNLPPSEVLRHPTHAGKDAGTRTRQEAILSARPPQRRPGLEHTVSQEENDTTAVIPTPGARPLTGRHRGKVSVTFLGFPLPACRPRDFSPFAANSGRSLCVSSSPNTSRS